MARRIKDLATAARMAELFPVPEKSAKSPVDRSLAAAVDSAQVAESANRYKFQESAAPKQKRAALRLRVSWAAAALSVLLALLIGAGVLWLGSGTGIGTIKPAEARDPAPAVTSWTQGPGIVTPGAKSDTTDAGNVLIVHIAGAVAKPGIVRLPPGSRLFEALDAAGGALPEAVLAAVNLAAELQDGAQILVPNAAEVAANPTSPIPTGPAGVATPGPSGTLNLNTASVEELVSLPRIGPVTAQRIVQWRAANGRFRSVDDLAAVDGIGMRTLESLRPLLVV